MTLARLVDEMKITNFDRFERKQVVRFFMEQDGYARFQTLLADEEGNLLKNVVESQSISRN